LEKKQREEAIGILMSKCSSNDIEKCISLAIKFDFMDEFIKKLITRANRNTSQVNVLLEYIEYLNSPERIIAQYDPEVRIGDIRDNL
jgi:hypothetical protein